MTRAELAGRELLGLHAERLVGVGGDVEQVLLAGRGLDQEQVAEVPERLAGDVAEVLAVLDEPPDHLERAADVADGDDVGELVLDLGARRAEQRPDRVVVDRPPPSTVAWSSSDSASRADPSAWRAIACAAAGSSVDALVLGDLHQVRRRGPRA